MWYYLYVTYVNQSKVGDCMDNANLILEMQKQYDNRTREQILSNLNTAISFVKTKGVEVDRYRSLPKITNKSKHTVMSWFNRPDKKIPLIDLCMLANYLCYNIFSFFTIKENGDVSLSEFLIANEYNNAKYPVDSANIYIRAYNLQSETDKDVVIDNLEKFYGSSKEILKHHSKVRQKRVISICNCTHQTYIAWFNRSRKNVHVPLISLCKLAIDCGVDVFYFFEEHETEE